MSKYKIFLSYASEQERMAEELKYILEQNGYQVFVAGANLQASADYERSIRAELARSQMFIFLASADSTNPGNYCLSEVKIASTMRNIRKRFAIIMDDVPHEKIPAWLTSVSVLRPKGNIATEVVHHLSALSENPHLRKGRLIAIFVGFSLLLAAAIFYMSSLTQNKGNKRAGNENKVQPKIYSQEISERSFSHPNKPDHSPTTVYGYLDFDDNSNARKDADLMISVPFFQRGKRITIRALASSILSANNDDIEYCRSVEEKPNGSELVPINLNDGRNFCLRTNKGRISKFQINQILTSWGADVNIDVRYTFKTFDFSAFSGLMHEEDIAFEKGDVR